jgi:hypothetical protein
MIAEVQKEQFWRREDPVIAKDGVRRGGFFRHQREWWDLPNYIKVLVGGYGSGKTLILCKRLISLALENAPVPVAAVSPTFSVARNTIIVTLLELLNGKKTIHGRDFHFKYNAGYHEFIIKYKGRVGKILVYSGDNPIALRGPNLAAAGVDEPFLQDIEVFKQMIARIRHPASTVRELLLTGTPEQLNWGYDLCVGDMKQENDVGVIHASTRLNIALPSDYVDHLAAAHTDKAALAYIEGQFVSLSEGLVYYGFSDANIQERPMPEDAEEGAGMDFNVDPMASAVFWHKGNHMHFFAEYELPNADTQYMCSTLKEKHPKIKNVFPDASGVKRATSSPGGKSDFHYIEEAGLYVQAHSSNPNRKDRYNSVNGKFSPKKGELSLTVDPKCKSLIKYLRLYAHEIMNMTAQKAMSHLLDAFSYPVEYLYPVSKDTLEQYKLVGV